MNSQPFSTLGPAVQALYDQRIEDIIAERNAANAQRRKDRMREKRKRAPRGRYLHPKPQSIVVRLLDEIERRGGMRVGEMAKFIWECSYPDIPYDPSKGRSRWGTNFYGSGPSGGLLSTFCKKIGKKWVRNGVSHEGQPWRVIRRNYNNRYQQKYHAHYAQGTWTVAQHMQVTSTPPPLKTIMAALTP